MVISVLMNAFHSLELSFKALKPPDYKQSNSKNRIAINIPSRTDHTESVIITVCNPHPRPWPSSHLPYLLEPLPRPPSPVPPPGKYTPLPITISVFRCARFCARTALQLPTMLGTADQGVHLRVHWAKATVKDRGGDEGRNRGGGAELWLRRRKRLLRKRSEGGRRGGAGGGDSW